MNDKRYAVAALNELKNNVLLLSMGNDYLSDERFLIKIGNSISRAVEVLHRDISFLKKEYPGKLMIDADTDDILDKLDSTAQRMLKPGKEIVDSCASGELSREIGLHVNSITSAVELIRMKVQGESPEYTRKEAAINVIGGIKEQIQSSGKIIIAGIKILICLIILAGALFCYLFFTMETEAQFQGEIASSQAYINTQRDLILHLEKERETLLNEPKSVSDKDLTREEKVAALDLNVKIQKINQNLEDLNAVISFQEKKIMDTRKKIQAFRKKPFIKRLLKQ